MIGKITGGGSFGGALEYLTQPKEKGRQRTDPERLKETAPVPEEHAPGYRAGERHRIIGGNMSGQTKGELTREFEAVSRQRPDIEKPVHHVSLSAGERDEISVAEWREVAGKYVEQMGYKDAPYVVIQHRDRPRDHVHILTSRVDVKGKVISDWRCKQRAEKVIREIEREYGLEQVKSSRDVTRAAPNRGELERFNRTGELSAKMALQGHVETALRATPTATEFIERLQLSGVEAIPYVQKDGRVTGISFRTGRELMKGSDLGRGFSWHGLQQRGLSYDQERDRPAIMATKERALLGRTEPTTALERTRVDFTKDTGRQVGEYLLDQVTAARQSESQMRMFEQVGGNIADGVTALHDRVTKHNVVEQLAHAAGLEARGKDAIERLQQAAGLEPDKDEHDALERLNKAVGLQRPDQPAERTPDHLPDRSPTREPAIADHVHVPVLEFTR